MTKKRYLFGATAVVGLGSLICELRNPAMLVPLVEKIPAEIVQDSSALDGASIYRKAADADGITRFTYAFREPTDTDSKAFLTHGKPVISDAVKKAVLSAFKDASTLASIEFREVQDFKNAEIKVSQLEHEHRHSGLGIPVPVPVIGGNLLISDKDYPLIDPKEIEKAHDCTVTQDRYLDCTPRKATPEEIKARQKINDLSQLRFLTRIAKHELLHVLGAKHAHHSDPGYGSFKKLDPKLLGDFDKTLMIYDGTFKNRDSEQVPYGELDVQFLQKNYRKQGKGGHTK